MGQSGCLRVTGVRQGSQPSGINQSRTIPALTCTEADQSWVTDQGTANDCLPPVFITKTKKLRHTGKMRQDHIIIKAYIIHLQKKTKTKRTNMHATFKQGRHFYTNTADIFMW